MMNMKLTMAKVAVSLVAMGSLGAAGLAGAGVAGAATATATAPATVHHHSRTNDRRLACTRDAKRLALAAEHQARFAAGTATYVKLQARAAKAGNTGLANYWAKVVTRRNDYSARQHANLLARTSRDAKTRGLVNGKCS
jgi:hypothetical protein